MPSPPRDITRGRVALGTNKRPQIVAFELLCAGSNNSLKKFFFEIAGFLRASHI